MAIKLPKLSKQQQQYLAGGALMTAALGFVYVKYFWMPTSERIKKARASIEEVSGKIDKALKFAARRPKLEAELAELNEKATDAERRLPRTKSVPDILVTVMKIAKKSNVAVLGFTPGTAGSKPFFFELMYPMRVKGSCHNIGRFLAGISLEERIFNVMNVIYGAADPATGIMEVTFTLLSYQYKG